MDLLEEEGVERKNAENVLGHSARSEGPIGFVQAGPPQDQLIVTIPWEEYSDRYCCYPGNVFEVVQSGPIIE